jgi:cell division protein FtsN
MAARSKSKSKIPGWIWLLTGVILGVFVTFLIRLSDLQPYRSHTNAKSKPSPKAQPQKPVQYDFYKVLKESEVSSGNLKSEESTKPLEDTLEYHLQVGSFRTPQDAEQVRVELTLLNLAARVEASTVTDGSTWHRVITGPYKTLAELSKAKTALADHKYQPIVLKRKPNSP